VGSPIIVVRVLGPNGVQKPNLVLVGISGFRFETGSTSTTTPIEKLKTFTMSETQKRGPGRPKGTKNRPGAKAGRPRKDAVKTMGSNPHTPILLQDAGMYRILEVTKFLFSRTFCLI
jgi:hypothetical protein